MSTAKAATFTATSTIISGERFLNSSYIEYGSAAACACAATGTCGTTLILASDLICAWAASKVSNRVLRALMLDCMVSKVSVTLLASFCESDVLEHSVT